MKRLITLLLVLAATVSAWAFDVNSLSYRVLTNPSGSTPGTVECSGFSSSGLNNSTATVPSIVTYDNATYTVVRVMARAFANKSKLSSINVYCKEIAEGAFVGCTNLSSVNLNGVTTVGRIVFEGCTALTSINIPASVTYLNHEFVDGCSNLTKITVASNNPNYSDFHGVLYNKSQSELLRVPEAYYDGTYNSSNFPANLRDVHNFAYNYCSKVTGFYPLMVSAPLVPEPF